MLTEYEAWQAIYDKCEKAGTIMYGLCWEVDYLSNRDMISSHTYFAMNERIEGALDFALDLRRIDPYVPRYFEGEATDRSASTGTKAWTLRRPIVLSFIEATKPSCPCPSTRSESLPETSSDSASSSTDSIPSSTHSNSLPR